MFVSVRLIRMFSCRDIQPRSHLRLDAVCLASPKTRPSSREGLVGMEHWRYHGTRVVRNRRLPMDFFTILVYTSGYLSLLFVAVCMGTHPWKFLSVVAPGADRALTISRPHTVQHAACITLPSSRRSTPLLPSGSSSTRRRRAACCRTGVEEFHTEWPMSFRLSEVTSWHSVIVAHRHTAGSAGGYRLARRAVAL